MKAVEVQGAVGSKRPPSHQALLIYPILSDNFIIIMFRSNSLAWNQHSTRRLMSNLPQQVDLLERYRGLVALGRIKYDENQVRVIMQVGLYCPYCNDSITTF